ncbi:MAG: terminase family protein, partial [Clostridia bacterium]
MPLTDMQQAYLAGCSRRWNVKTGATGSGKSYLDYSVVIPKRVLACRGEGLIVLLGNTRGTLERNILAPMRGMYGQELVSGVHADNTVDLFGKTAYALGADNKRHVARIQGITIEYGYGDEVATWAQAVFEMLKSRLRCEHSHFDGTCNPEGRNHWFKHFLDSGADIFQQSYTVDDNPMLPREFVENLKREYAGTVYYERFILGRWVAAEGAVYRTFADQPAAFLVDDAWVSKHPLCAATIGVDFGGNLSGHAFSCTGYENGLCGLVTLAEWYHKGEITPERLESAFVAFARMCVTKFGVRA